MSNYEPLEYFVAGFFAGMVAIMGLLAALWLWQQIDLALFVCGVGAG